MLSTPPTTRVPVLSTGKILELPAGLGSVLLAPLLSVLLAPLLSVLLSSASSRPSSRSSVVMFQCSKVFMDRVSFLWASGAEILPQGNGTGRGTGTAGTGCVIQSDKRGQVSREMLPHLSALRAAQGCGLTTGTLCTMPVPWNCSVSDM